MEILITVNTTPLRILLKKLLISTELDFIEVIDGVDILNKLRERTSPRVVILDNTEIVKLIRQEDKQTQKYTYIILITSPNTDIDSNIYVDNLLFTPINFNSLNLITKIALRSINKQKELEEQLNNQKRQIKKAQEIQQILNTPILPLSRYANIETVYNPSEELGGDFFNIIKTPHNNLAVIIVDCTGHGLEASMYATLLKSICDRHSNLLDNPKYLSSFVQMVNIDVADYITSDQFPVMFASIYSPSERKFYYSSANGEHPYIIRNRNTHKLEITQGMHLGYNTESQYHIKSFKIEDGDIIFFYSDAIIETKDIPLSRNNDTLLKQILNKENKNLKTLSRDMITFIEEYIGKTTLDDDLSLIYLQIKDPYHKIIKIDNSEIENEIVHLQKTLINYNYTMNEIEEILINYRELLLKFLSTNTNPDKHFTIEKNITCKDINIKIENTISLIKNKQHVLTCNNCKTFKQK